MKTLILNIDLSPLSIVTAHRGLVLSLNNRKIKVLEYYDLVFNSENDIFEVPSVLLYEKYIRPPRKKTVSKKYILTRDKMICQYCTKRLDKQTSSIDHVIPASRFNSKNEANTWRNLVASCRKCNTKKRNRTPEEAGMTLVKQPRIPNGFLTIQEGPETWRKYVGTV